MGRAAVAAKCQRPPQPNGTAVPPSAPSRLIATDAFKDLQRTLDAMWSNHARRRGQIQGRGRGDAA